MEMDTALAIFRELEKQTEGWVDDLSDEGRTAPAYSVRLDAGLAGSEPSGEMRYYTLFVKPWVSCSNPRDRLLYVFELAMEHGVEVEVDNSGLRIT